MAQLTEEWPFVLEDWPGARGYEMRDVALRMVAQELPRTRTGSRVDAMFRNLGLALLTVRLSRRQGQGAVAAAAGIGKSQLSKYENGKELPKLESLAKILRALGCTARGLVEIVDFLDRRMPPDTVTIRPGRAEDTKRLSLLTSRGPGADGGEGVGVLSRALSDPHRLLLVAEETGGEIAGFFCAIHNGPRARVEHLLVKPGPYREEVGAALLEAGLRELELRGARQVGALADSSSVLGRSLESWGFRPHLRFLWYEREVEAARREPVR